MRLSANLLDALKFYRMPSLGTVQQWSEMLAREARGRPLSAEQLTVAVRLANVAAKILLMTSSSSPATAPSAISSTYFSTSSSATAAGVVAGQATSSHSSSSSHGEAGPVISMYLPDSNGVLRVSSEELFCDDAPWLQGRIDRSKVPLVHSQVVGNTAMALGARTLSSAVREVVARHEVELATGHRVSPEMQTTVAKWNSNLASPAFQGAVRRASRYGKQPQGNGGGGHRHHHHHLHQQQQQQQQQQQPHIRSHGSVLSDVEVALRMSLLSRGQLVLTTRLPSTFLLDAGGGSNSSSRDITAQRFGSQAVLALEEEPRGNGRWDGPRGAAAAAGSGGGAGGGGGDAMSGGFSAASSPVVYLLVDMDGAGQPKPGWRRRWLVSE